MRISNKRAFVARCLTGLGALGLLERLAPRPGLVALCYHRIGDARRDSFYSPIISATPNTLRAQVLQLRRRFRLIGLEELLELADRDFQVTEPTVILTFDDGYRDNLDLAFPVLQELGAPALFAPTTAFLDQQCLAWWDHVAYVLRNTQRERLSLDVPERLEIERPAENAQAALDAVIAAYLRCDRPQEPGLLAHLEKRAGVEVDGPSLARSLYMNWDELRALADTGTGIGSHTVHHPRLSSLSEREQRAELRASKERLEHVLGRAIDTLVYPFGGTADVSPTTRALAKQAGYRLALSLTPGVNRPADTDPYFLRRFHVGPGDTSQLLRARLSITEVFGISPL